MRSACGLLDFDLIDCVTGTAVTWFFGLPVWAWALIALVVIGVVWKVAGWPGIVALAVSIGYALGRSERKPVEKAPPEPKPKRRKTLF